MNLKLLDTFDLGHQKQQYDTLLDYKISCMCFPKGSPYLFFGTKRGDVIVYDQLSASIACSFEAFDEHPIVALDAADDGSFVITATNSAKPDPLLFDNVRLFQMPYVGSTLQRPTLIYSLPVALIRSIQLVTPMDVDVPWNRFIANCGSYALVVVAPHSGKEALYYSIHVSEVNSTTKGSAVYCKWILDHYYVFVAGGGLFKYTMDIQLTDSSIASSSSSLIVEASISVSDMSNTHCSVLYTDRSIHVFTLSREHMKHNYSYSDKINRTTYTSVTMSPDNEYFCCSSNNPKGLMFYNVLSRFPEFNLPLAVQLKQVLYHPATKLLYVRTTKGNVFAYSKETMQSYVHYSTKFNVLELNQRAEEEETTLDEPMPWELKPLKPLDHSQDPIEFTPLLPIEIETKQEQDLQWVYIGPDKIEEPFLEDPTNH
ncbi:hypothetical protein PCE1_001525 [Barthelona sp. PCE]